VAALVARFAAVGAIALAADVAITAYASAKAGTREAVDTAERSTRATVTDVITPLLTDAVLRSDPTAIGRIDSVVRTSVLGGPVVRVKLWKIDGTVLYSDESRLIGKTFDLGADREVVFNGGKARADVSDLSGAENQFEVTNRKLLEVYELAHTSGGTPVLYETYYSYDAVTSAGKRLWAAFAPISIGSLVVLELAQIPLAWSMARRLRSGQRAREALLRHAIDASDNERRRIAGDLHDGVVQDLAGLSFSLAAAGMNEGIDRTQAAAASGALREAMTSLRSLLVDIYPPNLHTEGLPSALSDLLARLGARGITTRLDADPHGAELDADATTVLYRVAQEAARNVVKHSGATDVSMTLRSVADHTVELLVRDNGVGFEPGTQPALADGHLGLHALSDLVSQAGGQITVTSAPGRGTTVAAVVPGRRAVRA
jgi:signal transduction histidine kinase